MNGSFLLASALLVFSLSPAVHGDDWLSSAQMASAALPDRVSNQGKHATAARTSAARMSHQVA